MRTAGLTTGARTRAIRLHQNAKNVHATHVVAKTMHFLDCAHPKVWRIGRSGQAERYERGRLSIDKVNRFLLAAVRLLCRIDLPADGHSEAMVGDLGSVRACCPLEALSDNQSDLPHVGVSAFTAATVVPV
jgi:hypothetical protein